LEEKGFAFMPERPAELSHTVYCSFCYDSQVAPELEKYNETLKQARGVFVFYKDQGKETRLIKRPKIVYQVDDCSDRNETLMRLAFFAAKNGYNAIIDVDISGEKFFINGYQSTKWHGKALPAQVNANKYDQK
jgi:hypothetical protein